MTSNNELFEKTTLNEVTDIIGDGLHGTPNYSESGEYHFINGRNLDGKIIVDDKTYKVSEQEFLKYKKDLNSRTIFLSINGTLGKTAKYNDEKVVLGKSACYLNVKKNINKDYIYYLLQTPDFINYANNYSTGTTIKNLGLKAIREYPFELPLTEIQESIANILSSLDNKIENNNAIIANLEEQAQSIFKSWFVDFEPFQDEEFVESELGRIPHNWNVVNLKEVSEEIITGKTPPTKDSRNYGDKMPFVTIPDMHDNVYVTETERFLSNKGIETQKNKVIPKNSIAVSCIATVGLVTLISEDSQTNQQINTVITKDSVSPYYVYNYLKKQSDYLNAIGSSGSTTKNVNKSTFSNLKLILPKEDVLKKYHTLCEPIFDYILLAQKHNIKLADLRETLLPKLMSGEIRVEEAIEMK